MPITTSHPKLCCLHGFGQTTLSKQPNGPAGAGENPELQAGHPSLGSPFLAAIGTPSLMWGCRQLRVGLGAQRVVILELLTLDRKAQVLLTEETETLGWGTKLTASEHK